MNDEIVSIVICTLNRGKYLDRCLYCLFNQTFKNFKVIIVDQNSKDTTQNVIKKWKNKLNILHLMVESDGYSSPSKYRNLGWKHSNSKYISFTDPENLIPFDFLKKSLDYLMKNEKSITAYKPIMVYKEDSNRIFNKTKYKYKHWIKKLFKKELSYFNDDENEYIKKRKSWRDNHFSIIPIKALIEVNGANEKFDKWGFEGIDLIERIMAKGYDLYNFDKNSFVYHLWHDVERNIEVADKQRLLFGIKGCGVNN